MRWRKLGNVFCPDGRHPWSRSHATNPVVEPLGGDVVRVYFATRDDERRSSIGSVQLHLDRLEVTHVGEGPVIGPGTPGTFDDSGTVPGCLVQADSETRLYYMGWNLGVTVPWRNSIGMAVRSEGSGNFSKYAPAPVLDRNAHDPFTLSYPWVIAEHGRWRMWYGSNLRWGTTERDMDHVIKTAESDDGIVWRPTGRIAIAMEAAGEYAFSRPCVLHEGGLYRMWYSYRGAAYRIGYAESEDGEHWRRLDHLAGIEPGMGDEWDAGMVEYACVFRHGERLLMLYNGANYGRGGMGLAVLEGG